MPGAAIYARKSTESEDRQILSIDSQIRELKEFAQSQKLEIFEVFTESKSAKAPGRPVFTKLLTSVNEGKIDSLLVWKLDRLARNPVDGGAIIWAIEEKKLTAIHTPQRSFVNTGNDKFWMGLEYGMAKKYVDDLSDNVKRGLRAKLGDGWYPARAPIGYLNELSNHTIVKDPDTFPLVRKIWDLSLTGLYSPAKIQAIASREWGLRTKTRKRMGGNALSISSIYHILKNPFYFGYFRHTGGLYKGLHVPMISKSEFDRVQELIGRRSNPRPKSLSFTYRGLMKCGQCGAAITAEHKINRQGHHYTYYRCTRRKLEAKCTQKAVEERELERQMAEFLGTISLPHSIVEWALTVVRELDGEERAKGQSAFESLNRRYESANRELSELLNMKLRGLLSDTEFMTKKNELDDERIKLRELLDDKDSLLDRSLQRCEEFFEFTKMLKNRFENGTSQVRRAIMAQVCSDLLLKGKILSIQAQKPFNLVKVVAETCTDDNQMFAPPILGQGSPEDQPKIRAIVAKRGLVKDVRTFYLHEHSLDNFNSLTS